MLLHIHDLESQKAFRLIEYGAEPRLDSEYITQGLQVARDEISRGEVGKRSIEELITEAQRRQSD